MPAPDLRPDLGPDLGPATAWDDDAGRGRLPRPKDQNLGFRAEIGIEVVYATWLHLPVVCAGDHQGRCFRRRHHGGGPAPVGHGRGAPHAAPPRRPDRVRVEHRLPHAFENALLVLVRTPDLTVPERR